MISLTNSKLAENDRADFCRWNCCIRRWKKQIERFLTRFDIVMESLQKWHRKTNSILSKQYEHPLDLTHLSLFASQPVQSHSRWVPSYFVLSWTEMVLIHNNKHNHHTIHLYLTENWNTNNEFYWWKVHCQKEDMICLLIVLDFYQRMGELKWKQNNQRSIEKGANYKKIMRKTTKNDQINVNLVIERKIVIAIILLFQDVIPPLIIGINK